jgi:polar amino acid transport system substrate-binding protein
MIWRPVLVASLSIVAASCGTPRDPEGTSERIASTHELRVGVSDNTPWVDAAEPEPRGIEPDLVRAYAARVGAHVLWSRGSETPLMDALKHHELDVVIGGFDKKTHWSATAGITQPFTTDAKGKQHVFLTAPGENALVLSLDRFLTDRKRASETS